jgi:glutamate synthase domain-containing protein 3
MVHVTPLSAMDERVLRKLVQQHFHKTGSVRARAILAQWDAYRALFRKVAPPPPEAPAGEPVRSLSLPLESTESRA